MKYIKHGFNSLAVKVMGEIGIDISAQRSKRIDELKDKEFDYVLTLGSHAKETCPYFPAKIRMFHQDFDDPKTLAMKATNEEEALLHYRRVKDELKDYILTLPELNCE